MDSDIKYYTGALLDEWRAAAHAPCIEVAEFHYQLSVLYKAQLSLLMRTPYRDDISDHTSVRRSAAIIERGLGAIQANRALSLCSVLNRIRHSATLAGY